MAYEYQVTVDCADPHALADWWAETLGWRVEPQDEAFIRRMIDAGHAKESDTTAHNGALVWREGAAISHPEGTTRAPRMLFPAGTRGQDGQEPCSPGRAHRRGRPAAHRG